MKANALIALALAAGLTAGAAQAAYTGPSAGPVLEKVQVILDDGIDDQGFRVTGFIMKKVGDERYIFQDDTGSITADIDDDLFTNVQVNEKTKVELQGEIDRDLIGAPKIDVEPVELVRRVMRPNLIMPASPER